MRRPKPATLVFATSLLALALLLGAPLVIAWRASTLMMRPPWYSHPGPGKALAPGDLRDPEADFGLAYRDVAFPTAGGAVLRGWLIPSRAAGAGVVLAGGGWGDRRSLLGLAPWLHEAGYTVLVFDYREHGASDGRGRGASFGLREAEDVSAAVHFLKERHGPERVAVIGYSLGGTAAVLAAAADPGIDAVVASTPGATLMDLLHDLPQTEGAPEWLVRLIARVFLWRIDAPWESIASLEIGPLYVVDQIVPRPLLLIQGSDDDVNTASSARRLLERAGEPRFLLVVAGASHLDLFDRAPRQVRERVLRFLARSLAPTGSSVPRGALDAPPNTMRR